MVASGELGWSVMGTGTIATEHMVTAIRAIGQVPLWVVSRRRQDARHFAGDLGIPQATTDLRSVWKDPSVRFAYVSASRRRRQHYICAAAAAGRHILCDGPIAEDSRTAAGLVHVCREAEVRLVVNQPFRASTIHQTMKRLIGEGEVGTVQSTLIIRGGPYQPAPTRRNLCQDGDRRIHLDASTDDIDLARFLTGMEPIEAVALTRSREEPPDHLAYAIRMSDGSALQVHESFRTADIESLVLVAGDRGVLAANGTLNGRGAATLQRRLNGRNELIPVRDRDLPLVTIEGFASAENGGPSWLASGEDSVAALRTAEAVAISARKGRPMGIQLQTFPGHVLTGRAAENSR